MITISITGDRPEEILAQLRGLVLSGASGTVAMPAAEAKPGKNKAETPPATPAAPVANTGDGESKTYKIEDLRKAWSVKKDAKVHPDKMLAILGEHGVERLTDLGAEHYAAVFAKIEKLAA